MRYYYEDDEEFADKVNRVRDPGGRSALHPGKRTEDCPTCGAKNVLTKRDRAKGYQCDRCADIAEGSLAWEY